MTVGEKDKEIDDKKTYKEAFDDFDWNKNGTIPTRVNTYTVKFFLLFLLIIILNISVQPIVTFYILFLLVTWTIAIKPFVIIDILSKQRTKFSYLLISTYSGSSVRNEASGTESY